MMPKGSGYSGKDKGKKCAGRRDFHIVAGGTPRPKADWSKENRALESVLQKKKMGQQVLDHNGEFHSWGSVAARGEKIRREKPFSQGEKA